MTVHVGEVSSQVEVQGPAGGSGAGESAGGGGGATLQPSWDERARYRRVVAEDRRDRSRVDGAGFDG